MKKWKKKIVKLIYRQYKRSSSRWTKRGMKRRLREISKSVFKKMKTRRLMSVSYDDYTPPYRDDNPYGDGQFEGREDWA